MQIFSYPHCSVAGLDGDEMRREAFKQEMLQDFHNVLLLERLGHVHPTLGDLETTIFWRHAALVRLLFHLNESELRVPYDQRPSPSPTERLLQQLHDRWPDEKGAEDTHQHIRDCTRQRRHPHLTPERIFEQCREANVSFQRGIPSLTVDCATDACRRRNKCDSMNGVYTGSPPKWDESVSK